MKNYKRVYQFLTIIACVSVLFSCKEEADDIDKKENDSYSITITSPTNNTEFNLGDDISISANVVDSADMVESVNFYFDDALVESVSESPFSFTMNTQAYDKGSHTIKVEAECNDGSKKESSIDINLLESEALEIVSPALYIDDDQTWEANKIYKLREGTKISSTVTIEPGCIIKVRGHLKVIPGGKIIANGTADNPILFTSINTNIGGDNNRVTPKSKDWENIQLSTSGNVFNHCIFEYADETIREYYDDLTYTFTNCTFRHGYFGLNLGHIPAADSKIENCRFYSNGTPMSISAYVNIGNTNHFTNEDGTLKNDLQYISLMVIGVTPGKVEIKHDVTLTETSISYNTLFYIDISNNSTFTLKEGVVLKMGKMGATGIEYEEGCDFVMEKDSYVTSFFDNSLLGNPNSTATPKNDDWLGIAKDGSYIENMDNVLYSKYSSK